MPSAETPQSFRDDFDELAAAPAARDDFDDLAAARAQSSSPVKAAPAAQGKPDTWFTRPAAPVPVRTGAIDLPVPRSDKTTGATRQPRIPISNVADNYWDEQAGMWKKGPRPAPSTTPGATPAQLAQMARQNLAAITNHPELMEGMDPAIVGQIRATDWQFKNPEEKRAIQARNIAAYPENDTKLKDNDALRRDPGMPMMVPGTGLSRSRADIARAEQESIVPQSFMPALSAANKVIDVIEYPKKLATDTYGDAVDAFYQTPANYRASRDPLRGQYDEFGVYHPLPTPDDPFIERVRGIVGGGGKTFVGAVADPMMWPFLLAGQPEAALEEGAPKAAFFVSGAVRPSLQRATTAGFAGQMTVGTLYDASQVRKIWNDPAVPLDQKYEAVTGVLLGALMAAHGARSAMGHLDPSIADEINRMGARHKAELYHRLESNFKEGFSGSAVRSGAIDLPTPEHDQDIQAMTEYERRTGNPDFQPPPPAPPARPQGPDHLTPTLVQQAAQRIAALPEAQRGDAMVAAHQAMMRWMTDRLGQQFMGPDHQLHTVHDRAEAEKLAMQFVNDEVRRSRQQEAEEPQPANLVPQRPVQRPVAGEPIPPMGRNMTTDSAAVEKVQQQAEIAPGQEPQVAVKEESAADARKLAQPPAPVIPEQMQQVGKTEEESGRQIVQPSTSKLQNERLAADAAPELATILSHVATQIPGAHFDAAQGGRIRPQKNVERLDEKTAEGKPPETIGDYLAAQIVADSVETKNQIIALLKQKYRVLNVEDKFLEPREDKAGYASANVQIQMSNGSSAEVQIVLPEIQAVTDITHRLYTEGRGYPEGSSERNAKWGEAETITRQALRKASLRTGGGGSTPLLEVRASRRKLTKSTHALLIEATVQYEDFKNEMMRKYGIQDSSVVDTADLSRKQFSHVSAEDKAKWQKLRTELQDAVRAYHEENPQSIEDIIAKAIKRGKSEVIRKRGRPPVIAISDSLADLLTKDPKELTKALGGVIEVRNIAKLVSTLRGYAAKINVSEGSSLLEQFADQVEQNVYGSVGTAFRRDLGHSSAHELIEREEICHLFQGEFGQGKILEHLPTGRFAELAQLPEAMKGKKDLSLHYGNLGDAELVTELAAKLISGHAFDLTLTPRERDRFLDAYFREISEQHGVDAPSKFAAVACDDALASIQRVRKNYRQQ